MKKSFLCTILLLIGSTLNAQVSHPQDTLVSRVPNYFYQFWFDSIDCEVQHGYWDCNKLIKDSYFDEIAKYNYTDKMLKVVGVAAMIYTKLETGIAPGFYTSPTTIDTTYDNWFEIFSLYKPSDTGMALLASQRYTVLDTARCVKVYYNPEIPVPDSVGSMILPVFEAYFDKPVYITDSFYVAATNYNGKFDPQTNTYPGFSAHILCYKTPSWPNITCFPQKRARRFMGGDWDFGATSIVDFIFPIIALDTCKPVTGLTFDGQDSLHVYLSWLRGEHNDSWELAYGPAVADPDSFAVVDCNNIRCTLQGLTPGTKYAARVRGVCFNDSVYSDWSDTIQFHVAEYNPPVCIPSVTANAPFTLTPNPAHDYVVLDLKDGVSDPKHCTLTVSDASGREVLSLNIAAPHTRINTRTLPKGMYFVTLTTPKGSSTQKLIVE